MASRRCPACAADFDTGLHACPACGVAMAADAGDATALPPTPVLRSPTPSANAHATPPHDGARFMPGMLLAGRYRIVSLLGRGGMGEVYRAEDTRLGQTVALKFLPDALAADPVARARFYAEVRLGRQVSHPNVCHIYDLVEIEGHPCLSMEFVDGEDLGSLLRRIGRLPADKALDVARDVCAGLAAAHDKGIVHRDLKPANVMLDGQGRARITDFGIAALVDDIAAQEVAGTPAYMAPEQRAGLPASVRSDVYSLALVLHEAFTGARWRDTTPVPAASDITQGGRDVPVDVARVVAACLAHDPMLRPANARAVLATLPGGDALQAAVAAGETPSPEMVAAAGVRGDLGVGAAWSCLAAAFAGIALLAWISASSSVIGRLQPDKSPEVLAEKARAVVAAMGHAAPARDAAWLFLYDTAALAQARQARDARALTEARPGPLLFAFRQSPAPLAATRYARMLVTPAEIGRIDHVDPPPIEPGMASVVLDRHGALTEYVAVPPRRLERAGAQTPDWSVAFAAAGLDPAAFAPVAPRASAPVDNDAKFAWEGTLPAPAGARMRVEAASLQGRPVWFALHDVAPPEAEDAAEAAAAAESIGIWAALAFCLAVAPPLVWMIRRNLRLGRGDRRGARRLAGFAFTSIALALLLRADHVGVVAFETPLIVNIVAQATYFAASIWVSYVAFEPYARRRWPQSMISWSRLLGGELRDPMVGRDVLFGLATGIAMALVLHGHVVLADAFAPGTGVPVAQPVSPLSSNRHALFFLLLCGYHGISLGIGNLVGLLLLQGFVRVRAIALALQFGLAYLFLGSLFADASLWSPAVALLTALWLALAVRVGLLAAIVAAYAYVVLGATPLTLDPGRWYFPGGALVVGTLLALAVYAFRIALGGKPVLGRALQELEAT